MLVPCALGCGQQVYPSGDPNAWKEVRGFVGGAKSDSMVLRQDTGNWAHGECVAKARAGQAVDQESMFDE